VGWLGSGPRATNSPSAIVAVAPQRETHSGQKVETSVMVGSVIGASVAESGREYPLVRRQPE
jgi:hypothetical protein